MIAGIYRAKTSQKSARRTDMNILQRAIEVVREEQSTVRAERNAFQTFRRRVRPMAITSGPGFGPRDDSSSETGTEDTTPDVASTGDVRYVYRETVMDTSHYGTDYGNDVNESLNEELSPTLAEVLGDGRPLTAGLKRRVLSTAERAERQREALAAVLETELSSLEAARDELEAVDRRLEEVALVADPTQARTRVRSFENVVDRWLALDCLEDRCEVVVNDRQQTIRQTRNLGLGLDNPFSFDEYLYSGLETTHPVLRVAAETVERIDKRRFDGCLSGAPA